VPKGKRSKKEKNSSIDIQVILLLFASIILAVLIYTRSGYIGETLSPFLGGIIGWVKYIVPIGTALMAVYLIREEDRQPITKKLIKYAILIISISVIITVYHDSRGTFDCEYGEEQTFEQMVAAAYESGTGNIGGGAIRSNSCCASYKLARAN